MILIIISVSHYQYDFFNLVFMSCSAIFFNQ